jgi:hypothetical protein
MGVNEELAEIRERLATVITKKGLRKYLDNEFFVEEDHINNTVTNITVTEPTQLGDEIIYNVHLTDNSVDISNITAAALRKTAMFYVPGALSIADNVSAEIKLPANQDWYFDVMDLRVKTAPSGGNVSVRIEDDGVSSFTGSIISAAKTAQTNPNVLVAASSVLTLDLTAVNGAEDLTVLCHFYPVEP